MADDPMDEDGPPTSDETSFPSSPKPTELAEASSEHSEQAQAAQAASAAQQRSVDERNRARQVAQAALQRPDAILEPDCFPHLKRFIANGGTPQDVIQYLSSGYKGFPEMCNLVCQWLKFTGMSQEEIVTIVENYFKETIKTNFDPKRADSIVAGSGEPPEWLEQMLQTQSWRQLFYDLSEQNPDCLLLNFAIQSVSRAGHLSEIAPLGATANYFTLYNQVLSESFANLGTFDEQRLTEVLATTKQMCNHTEASYLYSQALLHTLAAEPNGVGFKRISEELEAEVKGLCTPAQRAAWYLTTVSDNQQVLSSLQSMLSSGQSNEADIGKLHSAYSSSSPPPVAYIRRPDLFDILVKDMFSTASVGWDPHYRRQYSFVVAYAASAKDDRPVSAMAQAFQPSAPLTTNGIPPEVEQTLSAIVFVQERSTRPHFGVELAALVEEFREVLPYQVVAAGLLFWVRPQIADREHFATTFNTKSLSTYLDVIKEISFLHPFLRPKIFSLLVDSFETESDLEAIVNLEAKKALLENLVYLVELGFVMPVLNAVRAWSQRVDYSLTRHFVVKMLELIAPPYSPEFLEVFLAVIFAVPVESMRAGEASALVSEFLAHVVSAKYTISPQWIQQAKQRLGPI